MAMKTKFKRIILHWTAGTDRPNAHDKQCYHYLIDSRGFITNGVYPPEANLDCKDGVYAAHTGGGNTGSIGVALCGMKDFSYPSKYTPFPITKLQLETAFSFVAKLCVKYDLEVNKDTVLTHYEFGQLNPKTSSHSKIDIIYMPPYPAVHKYQVGEFIRQKICWYVERLETENR